MKLFNRAKFLVIAVGCVLALLRAEAAETSLIAFELGSHDKQTYTQSSWAGRPLLMFVSTREAATHNAGLVWSAPLTAAVSASVDDVVPVRVGSLPRGVPRLFAGMVRDALAPAEGDAVRISLLDWEGTFAQRYELAGDSYNVLLFNRSGELVYRAALDTFSQGRLDVVLRELQALTGQL